MPDFDLPEVKEAACRAIRDGFNQYAVTWGIARSGTPLPPKCAGSTVWNGPMQILLDLQPLCFI